jgi:hypothetical protein
MNVRLLSYICKSKYKTKDRALGINGCVAFAVEMAICLCAIINEATGKSEPMRALLLYLVLMVAYCYVVFHYACISRKKKRERLESLQSHHDYLKLSLWGLALTAAIIVAIAIICATRGISLSQYVYIWFIPVMLMFYVQGYYLKSVVLFGEEYYRSGEYIVYYGGIEKIEVAKVYTNVAYPISLVAIYDKTGIAGMDKFFVEESAYLMEKTKEANP